MYQIEKDWTHGRQQETIVGAQKATFKMEHVVRVFVLSNSW